MEHILDKNFFPGWVRKAVTFTIDDGDILNDKRFIDIVRPAGILGTFNLCATDRASAEEYRELYRGFEIANHVRLHPRIFTQGVTYPLIDEVFDVSRADPSFFYRHPEIDGMYYFNIAYFSKSARYRENPEKWWRIITSPEVYIRLMDEAHADLESVFGKGSVRSFVWPFGLQDDYEAVREHVRAMGYYGARDAGDPTDSFELPRDRMNWVYNANDATLLDTMERFDALDEPELRIFSFGVHSVDYERAGRWGDLERFAEKYGNRPNDFYYATVGDIFDYEDALASLEFDGREIRNPSSRTLFVKLDDEPITLEPRSTYNI